MRLHVQAAQFQLLLQFGRRVAALVGVDLVVVAPQPHKGRHGDDQLAAGLEHAGALGKHAQLVRDVLDRIEQGHQVEGVRQERAVRCRCPGRRSARAARPRAAGAGCSRCQIPGRSGPGGAPCCRRRCRYPGPGARCPDGPAHLGVQVFQNRPVRPANQAWWSSSSTVKTGVAILSGIRCSI